jgi:GNAT superfamily N-acetyltransferase
MGQLRFRGVDSESWPDFARLFEDRGCPKHCWCMVWRASSAEARQSDGASRCAQIQSRVEEGVPIGILGYLEDRPVAWCSIAPRETYRPLGGPLDSADKNIWSLVCLFIKREYRGRGLTHELIQAAIAYAIARGATTIEAYPAERNSPSYRFIGFVDTFASLGFREIGRTGQRRHVMRLHV